MLIRAGGGAINRTRRIEDPDVVSAAQGTETDSSAIRLAAGAQANVCELMRGVKYEGGSREPVVVPIRRAA